MHRGSVGASCTGRNVTRYTGERAHRRAGTQESGHTGERAHRNASPTGEQRLRHRGNGNATSARGTLHREHTGEAQAHNDARHRRQARPRPQEKDAWDSHRQPQGGNHRQPQEATTGRRNTHHANHKQRTHTPRCTQDNNRQKEQARAREHTPTNHKQRKQPPRQPQAKRTHTTPTPSQPSSFFLFFFFFLTRQGSGFSFLFFPSPFK